MTEEQKDQLAAEEGAAQEEAVPVEAEDGASAEGRKTGWALAVAVIAAILVLCTVVVCSQPPSPSFLEARTVRPCPGRSPLRLKLSSQHGLPLEP